MEKNKTLKNFILIFVSMMALVGASGIFLYLTNSEPSKNSQTESRGAPPFNYTQQLKQCLPKIGPRCVRIVVVSNEKPIRQFEQGVEWI